MDLIHLPDALGKGRGGKGKEGKGRERKGEEGGGTHPVAPWYQIHAKPNIMLAIAV